MAIWNKEEFLKQLYANDKYKLALASAKNEAERKKIAKFGNEFVGSFAEILAPVFERAKNDPMFANQLNQAIIEHRHVITSEPTRSGSTE